ncbi:hypothetical protein ACFO5K_05330 [Nocardia halotolerans]|uniref:Uncharacterized protein n=1 Tax=Nocardia halotolerans TaxID=1755878 RepID=A0ABV8VC55_9NOCA
MAVLSRPLASLATVLGVAVVIPMIATLVFAAADHPECAINAAEVGPCGYWPRVAEYGPLIMLVGTPFTAGLASAVWLTVIAVLGIVAALRPPRPQNR